MTDDNVAAPYRNTNPTPVIRGLRTARELLYRAGGVSGINPVVSRTAWRDNRLLILCYHGISIADEHEWSELYVPQEHLERRVKWLRANQFNILPLDEASHAMYARRLPPRAVTLTFDDGSCDFALKAMPVLAAYRVPATVYLTTYHVTSQLPIFGPMASYLLWKAPGRTYTVPGTSLRRTAPPRDDREARSRLQLEMADRARLTGLSAQAKHSWLVTLAAELDLDFDALLAKRLFHLMSPAELASLDRDLVDLQLHTHRHTNPDDAVQFRREIDDNRGAMQDYVRDKPLRHFCYPSGVYTADQVRWLADAGVVSATTCNPGLAGPGHSPWILPRLVDTQDVTDAKFAAWAHGIGHIIRRFIGGKVG